MDFKQKYSRLPILKACLLAAGLLAVQGASAQKKQKPNIVLVLPGKQRCPGRCTDRIVVKFFQP